MTHSPFINIILFDYNRVHSSSSMSVPVSHTFIDADASHSSAVKYKALTGPDCLGLLPKDSCQDIFWSMGFTSST